MPEQARGQAKIARPRILWLRGGALKNRGAGENYFGLNLLPAVCWSFSTIYRLVVKSGRRYRAVSSSPRAKRDRAMPNVTSGENAEWAGVVALKSQYREVPACTS